MQLSLVQLCLHWPRFYYIIFTTKQNWQPIWKIITKPVPHGGTKARKPSNRLVCLNQKFCCFSFYQTQGAYAHLEQKSEKDLDEAVAAATAAVFYDDPLHLAIPYTFFLERLPYPPNGLIKSVLSFELIIFLYLYPILKVLISLWLIHIGAYTFSKILVNKDRRRRKRQKPLPKLHIKSFSANASSDYSAFYWNTDGIPFVVDNYATIQHNLEN